MPRARCDIVQDENNLTSLNETPIFIAYDGNLQVDDTVGLKRNILSAHTTINRKEYKCNDCQRSFKSALGWKLHEERQICQKRNRKHQYMLELAKKLSAGMLLETVERELIAFSTVPKISHIDAAKKANIVGNRAHNRKSLDSTANDQEQEKEAANIPLPFAPPCTVVENAAESTVYLCKLCDVEFYREESYHKHRMFTHPPTLSLRCQCCKAKFSEFLKYWRHMRTAHVDRGHILGTFQQQCRN